MSLTQRWGPVHPLRTSFSSFEGGAAGPRDVGIRLSRFKSQHPVITVAEFDPVLSASWPLCSLQYTHIPHIYPLPHFPRFCSDVTGSRQPARSLPLCSTCSWASPHKKLLWLPVTHWRTRPVSGYSHSHKTHTWRHTQASALPTALAWACLHVSEPPGWNPD